MGKPLDPERKQRIDLVDAAAATRAFRKTQTSAYAFNAGPILELLGQTGCVGIRFYPGINKDGDASLIGVGVDANGNDMTKGYLVNEMFPCPPFCPDGNELNS